MPQKKIGSHRLSSANIRTEDQGRYTAKEEDQHRTHRVTPIAASLFMCLLSSSALAQELAPLENIADFIVDFLTGAFARSVAIIAVAVLGYLGLTGRLRWGVAGSVIAGIAIIFGAATIVDAISGSV